ncbi:MAG: hypothetical protein ACD_60C00009G0002 [uncultured bacterium]|nr:MAG: hypothetical protein ACD_60C00009G0002 [uncultured bacterium]
MNIIDLDENLKVTWSDIGHYEEMMVNDGYVLLKNIISLELLNQIKKNIHHTLVSLGAQESDPFTKQYNDVIKIIPPFTLNIELKRHFIFAKFPHKILHIPLIFNFLIRLLGPDLAFLIDAELPVNINGKTDHTLVKKFHQEFWSGAGYRTFVLWSPLIFPKGSGGLEIIKGSHLWGHIPHRNREPLHIPTDAKSVIIDSDHHSERDVVLFHSLTLHRTIPNAIDHPRLAYATHVRNIFEQDTGFEIIKNWEIFNLSATSKIMKACGNPHLSPFRTLNLNLNESSY